MALHRSNAAEAAARRSRTTNHPTNHTADRSSADHSPPRLVVIPANKLCNRLVLSRFVLTTPPARQPIRGRGRPSTERQTETTACLLLDVSSRAAQHRLILLRNLIIRSTPPLSSMLTL